MIIFYDRNPIILKDYFTYLSLIKNHKERQDFYLQFKNNRIFHTPYILLIQ